MRTISTNGPVIEFRDVLYVLPNGQMLLRSLNLQVQRGETLVLLGRSGSGKTTTLKLINRLPEPERRRSTRERCAHRRERRDSLAAKHRLCHTGCGTVPAFHG